MNKTPFRESLSELLLSMGVLALIVYYSSVFIFTLPYNGFRFRGDSGEITHVYTHSASGSVLSLGDQISKVDNLTWSEFWLQEKNLAVTFRNHQPGDRLLLTIIHDGEVKEVEWVFPPVNLPELVDRTFLEPWLLLPLALWVCGLVTLFAVRPRDRRRNLLAAFYYLLAIWTVTVLLWDINYSGVIFTLASWMLIPVSWHLHWVFPKVIRELNPWIWLAIYLSALAAGILNIILLPDRLIYPFPLIVAIGGSILLLLVHYLLQPELRSRVRLLLAGLVASTLPGLLLLATNTIFYYPLSIRAIAFSFLAVLPLTYFYVLYYHRLGSSEIRTNSVISLVFYEVIIFLINYLVIYYFVLSYKKLETPFTSILLVSLVTGLLTALFYPALRAWFERRVLGVALPKQDILTSYAGRIITASDIAHLDELITTQVLPSLLIRQALFLRVRIDQMTHAPLLCDIAIRLNIQDDQLPPLASLDRLICRAGRLSPLPQTEVDPAMAWIRLVLTKQASPQRLMLCLFGRRDPDDYYSQNELPILQALVDNTTLALVNIQQTRLLHTLYQEDIQRQELERTQLALDLHDDVLNQLALLALAADESENNLVFKQAYHTSVQHIREIISGLRPPLINYGLGVALDGLSDEVIAVTKNGTKLEINVTNLAERYQSDVELHLYRIVQQACLNAVKHSQAHKIRISGELFPHSVQLSIEDDGAGFEPGAASDISWLLQNKHFGLAGMFERASLIGATLTVNSAPGEGAQIQVAWQESAKSI